MDPVRANAPQAPINPAQNWQRWYQNYNDTRGRSVNDPLQFANLTADGRVVTMDIARFAQAEINTFRTGNNTFLAPNDRNLRWFAMINGFTGDQAAQMFRVLDRNNNNQLEADEIAAFHMLQDQQQPVGQGLTPEDCPNNGTLTMKKKVLAALRILTNPQSAGEFLDAALQQSPIRERLRELNRERPQSER